MPLTYSPQYGLSLITKSRPACLRHTPVTRSQLHSKTLTTSCLPQRVVPVVTYPTSKLSTVICRIASGSAARLCNLSRYLKGLKIIVENNFSKKTEKGASSKYSGPNPRSFYILEGGPHEIGEGPPKVVPTNEKHAAPSLIIRHQYGTVGFNAT